MSKLPFKSVAKAITRPDGCQAGNTSLAAEEVSLRLPLPSAFIIHRSKLPPSFGSAT
jgi:hypothetical protein